MFATGQLVKEANQLRIPFGGELLPCRLRMEHTICLQNSRRYACSVSISSAGFTRYGARGSTKRLQGRLNYGGTSLVTPLVQR